MSTWQPAHATRPDPAGVNGTAGCLPKCGECPLDRGRIRGRQAQWGENVIIRGRGGASRRTVRLESWELRLNSTAVFQLTAPHAGPSELLRTW